VKLIWSPLALDRLSEIAAYIAHDRPSAAEQWVERMFAAVDRLQEFPLGGRVVPEVGRPEIREVIEGEFRVIYRIEPDQLSVLTVRHARQSTAVGDFDAGA
jgi:toxin ParE1/3/4